MRADAHCYIDTNVALQPQKNHKTGYAEMWGGNVKTFPEERAQIGGWTDTHNTFRNRVKALECTDEALSTSRPRNGGTYA